MDSFTLRHAVSATVGQRLLVLVAEAQAACVGCNAGRAALGLERRVLEGKELIIVGSLVRLERRGGGRLRPRVSVGNVNSIVRTILVMIDRGTNILLHELLTRDVSSQEKARYDGNGKRGSTYGENNACLVLHSFYCYYPTTFLFPIPLSSASTRSWILASSAGSWESG